MATSKLVECWKAPTLHTAARGLDTCQKDKRPCSDITSGEGLLFTCTNVICHTSYLIKADSIHADSDRVSGEHLLRGHLIWHSPEVHTGVLVYTRQDEEQAGPRGPALLQTTQSEDDCSLILLDNFDTVTKWEGKRQKNKNNGEKCKNHCSKSGYFFIINSWDNNGFSRVFSVNAVIIFLSGSGITSHCQTLKIASVKLH